MPAAGEKPDTQAAPPKPEATAAPPKPSLQQTPATHKKPVAHGPPVAAPGARSWIVLGLAGLALYGVGLVAPPSFMARLTVFVLSCFIGYQVIWNVTPALHTPLMSVTNAISGIIILGGMLQITGGTSSAAELLGLSATFLAMINVAGGFLVTQRMLKMFRR